MFGTLGYAETEFWTSWLKLIVVAMFLIISVVCICGGGPANGAYSEYIGAKHWYDPGAFANGFKGVCSVFVTAAFSYSGSELVSFAACETPNPRATLPSAIKNIFWRIILIYLTLILLIGLAVPYDDPLLTEGSGASVSPFVVVMKKAGITGVDRKSECTPTVN
jgi:amino acid transporter